MLLFIPTYSIHQTIVAEIIEKRKLLVYERQVHKGQQSEVRS
jgi:hypothetical protein